MLLRSLFGQYSVESSSMKSIHTRLQPSKSTTNRINTMRPPSYVEVLILIIES